MEGDGSDPRDTAECGAFHNAHGFGNGTVPALREAARQSQCAQDRARALRCELQGHGPLLSHGPRAQACRRGDIHRAVVCRGEGQRKRSLLGTSPHGESTLD